MASDANPEPRRRRNVAAHGHSADLERLPRVDSLVAAAGTLVERYGRAATTRALREAVDTARRALLAGSGRLPAPESLVEDAARALGGRRPGPLRPVVNATGVVVHTNLGRAPLSPAARAALDDAAGYCDLEMDLTSGARSSRDDHLTPLLADVALRAGPVDGMPEVAGIAVNNAAAALVLALTALAAGRQVPVSRGELVEIGGAFRLPDIMAVSGARLLEVGTTNRTRPADYLAGDDVGLLLKVHPSNYRMTGFTQTPSVAEVAAVAKERGVALLHDTGSGLLDHAHQAPWAADEPSVAGSLHAGADLVVCSADKLLGGPQAGLLVGRAELVDRCRRHPLARALRLDKLRIAALAATLNAHLSADGMPDVPVWRMLAADPQQLAARCRAVAGAIGPPAEVAEASSLVGGGAAPGTAVPGTAVRLPHPHCEAVAALLRSGHPPIVARIDRGALWFDLRTVAADQDGLLVERVASAVHGS